MRKGWSRFLASFGGETEGQGFNPAETAAFV
jgi:hypothetical protein